MPELGERPRLPMKEASCLILHVCICVYVCMWQGCVLFQKPHGLPVRIAPRNDSKSHALKCFGSRGMRAIS